MKFEKWRLHRTDVAKKFYVTQFNASRKPKPVREKPHFTLCCSVIKWVLVLVQPSVWKAVVARDWRDHTAVISKHVL